MPINRYIFFLVILFLLSLIFFLYQNSMKKEYSLDIFLKSYGFNTEQQDAFKNLFEKSTGTNKSWDEIFPNKSSKEELLFDMLNLIELVQKNFVNRTGTQERWENKPPDWINQYNKKEIINNLEILGFINSIEPKETFFDAICILGGTKNTMSQRIDYAESLIKNGLKTNSIILLAGERYVSEKVDGNKVELNQLAEELNIKDWTKLTETNLIENLYKKSSLSNNKINYYLIDTPARDLPRPTTQTTILELINWLKEHPEIKNILFISNQPYVKYQGAIIESTFKNAGVKIKIEIAGNEFTNLTKLDTIIEGLGAYIWAAFPNNLSKMDINIKNLKIKESLKKLYYKNPLIYNTIPKNLLTLD